MAPQPLFPRTYLERRGGSERTPCTGLDVHNFQKLASGGAAGRIGRRTQTLTREVAAVGGGLTEVLFAVVATIDELGLIRNRLQQELTWPPGEHVRLQAFFTGYIKHNSAEPFHAQGSVAELV